MNDECGSAGVRECGGEVAWEVEALRFRYQDAKLDAVDRVTASVAAGRCTAVLGPNGSGKSTLMRLMLGTLRPDEGSIRFGGKALSGWTRKELAREIGVVPQFEEAAFPMSVRQLVAMGRYPTLGPWRREGDDDRRAISTAMDRCEVADLADRPIATLSGGEKQRVRVARALAQEPRVLALDEPTLALDIRHEMAIFELLRDLVGGGVTVLIITHNLDLASRYADSLILLDRGRVAAHGTPTEVIDADLLTRVYGWPVRISTHPGPGPDTGAPQVVPLGRNDFRHSRARGNPASSPEGTLDAPLPRA
ncbi:MAG TPA: ABC transporter ATP-binding protein [Longimicrobiaceae bacterium]|nr:ABC transporter ATP-binding protein [Longimicrobiaceae bacterium]